MIYSMTGFGRAEQTIFDKTFLVEVRALNGKQYDVRLTMPSLLKPYEFEIRNILNEQLLRGSVECIITLKQNGSFKPVTVNKELIKTYYESFKELAEQLGANTEHLLSAILRFPDVVAPSTEVLQESEWQAFQQILHKALLQLNKHRAEEGKVLEADLLEHIHSIESLQASIAALIPLRKQKIRENITKLLEEQVGKENYDANRLEQELIYYIEKIDMSEEQVRLKNHCAYFQQVLQEKEISKGKKLAFILQEVGREINTTGAKAYDAEVQKQVVMMKDELEKIKEQILNVL